MLTYKDVGLSEGEYQEIVRLLARTPNDLELGLFGALWSEHCSYKNSKPFLAWLPHEGPFVVQGPGGNAGVVRFNQDYDVAFKIESHNHPSYVEPLQGAATGVGGILRDIIAMGARPIAVADILKFGTNQRAHALRHGIVEGIGAYGNAIGIPTVTGSVGYSALYDANPLVNVLAVGLLPQSRHVGADGAKPGSVLLLMGQSTGRDGIHGASLLASQDFGTETESMRPTVQVGDPFMGKLLMEATLAIVTEGLADAVQDLGAAGLTSALAELAYASQVGVTLDVGAVPCRETGMSAYDIMLSETQERMLLSVPKSHLEAALRTIKTFDLSVAEIGRVMPGDFLRIYLDSNQVADVPTQVLVASCPRHVLPNKFTDRFTLPANSESAPIPLTIDQDLGFRVLRHPDCQDRSPIYSRYDSTIQVRTVWGPDHDSAILHLGEASEGLQIAVSAPSRWALIDSVAGGYAVVVDVLSRVASQGAVPLGLTDGINGGNPDKPEEYERVAGLVWGIAQAARDFGVPVTGGNVSLHNETESRAIWPTAALGVVARHPHPKAPVADRPDAKGLTIALVNPPGDPTLGGSVLAEELGRIGAYPRIAPDVTIKALNLMGTWARDPDAVGLLACRSIGVGGLFVALSRALMSRAPQYGADLRLSAEHAALDLFNETAGQFLVFLDPALKNSWVSRAQDGGVTVKILGETTDSPQIKIQAGRTVTFELHALWQAFREGGGSNHVG